MANIPVPSFIPMATGASVSDNFVYMCKLKKKAGIALTVEESKRCPIAIEQYRDKSFALFIVVAVVVIMFMALMVSLMR
jgi:hypothetical protein